jgi:hypothetical protein
LFNQPIFQVTTSIYYGIREKNVSTGLVARVISPHSRRTLVVQPKRNMGSNEKSKI